MKRTHFKPFYNLSIKGIEKTEHVKECADLVVKNIMDTCGNNIDLQLRLEPEKKKQRAYTVTLTSSSFGSRLVVKKSGRNISSILKRAKRKFIRNARRLSQKEYTKKNNISQTKVHELSFEEAI